MKTNNLMLYVAQYFSRKQIIECSHNTVNDSKFIISCYASSSFRRNLDVIII